MKTTVQTGGKLYIAGEYSILTPGQVAVIKHIPIYMTATVEEASVTSLQSDMFDYIVGMEPDKGYELIQASVRTFEDFYGKPLSPFKLTITGKFEKDGLKFGIGSSGSVTVLTIKALAKHCSVDLPLDQLFKLSAYTLLKLGDNGSMGDIACIAYGDLIAYQSFDRTAIAQKIAELSLQAALELDWGYVITPIHVALPCDFLVGWTRQPAISKDMINLAKSSITPAFLQSTQVAVQALSQGLEQGNKQQVITALQEVSDLLKDLNPAIYTKRLLMLKEAEQGLDVMAKSSGAGGGDCGIALSFTSQDSQQLIRRWEKTGIELLYKERLGIENDRAEIDSSIS